MPLLIYLNKSYNLTFNDEKKNIDTNAQNKWINNTEKFKFKLIYHSKITAWNIYYVLVNFGVLQEEHQ